MNLTKRLVAVAVVGVFALLVSAASAQDKPDLSNAGQAKAKRDAREWLDKNKPTDPLVVPDQIIRKNFDADYKWSYPARGEEDGDDGEGGMRSITYKYHVVNAIRLTMLEAAKADANIFEVWVDKEADLKNELEKHYFGKDPEIVSAFMKDWLEEATKATKDDEAAFKKALTQGAYQITQVALEIQADQEREAGTRSSVASSGGNSSGSRGTAGAAASGGSSHADVVHARLMNGIYRRHDRRMNKIETHHRQTVTNSV